MYGIYCSILSIVCFNQYFQNGHLDDPYQEFFFEADTSVQKGCLLYCKYNLPWYAMISRFITPNQANKIVVISKLITLLIHICGKHKALKIVHLFILHARESLNQDSSKICINNLIKLVNIYSKYWHDVIIVFIFQELQDDFHF